jgi:carbamoyltransferase
MKILGIGCSSFHDPSAALLVDGELVAAAEEERFTRRKHAHGQNPVHAARFCLERAGIAPEEIDRVAYPWSAEIIREKRAEYARRAFSKSPAKALRSLTKVQRLQRRRVGALHATLRDLGIDPARAQPVFVEHHLAHASSAFHLSGFPSAAILTLDGYGELTSSLLAEGLADGRIVKRAEILKPDSLGLFYSTLTEYLGFDANDGEYKVMGMAPYGDPAKCDLGDMVRLTDDGFRCDDELVWVDRKLRVADGRHYSQRLLDRLGPARSGDALSEPYIHVAAATQKRLEDVVLGLVDRHLGDVLDRNGGRLAFSGGVALNVRLNRKLIQHPKVSRLWVQPASSDAGISLGAATFAAVAAGETVAPMRGAALGPSFDGAQVRAALERLNIPYETLDDPPRKAAELLAAGEIVSWLEGRMEFGPRALGQRSILGHPGIRGTADAINERIKFRESWRPFCPSVLAERASELFDSDHPSPYMTFTFGVRPLWAKRVPEIVHVDGTARPQLIDREHSPRFHQLVSHFCDLTGLPVVINTSLNRRGEPMVCSPADAIAMLYGSGLEFLIMEDVLVSKRRV